MTGWDLVDLIAEIRHWVGAQRALLRARHALPLLGVALIALTPFSAGTQSLLRVPVLYRRVELNTREPVVLELDLPPGDLQIEPASLGYFVDSTSGPRQFVFTGDVPRGLIYTQLPATRTPDGRAAQPGSVVVLELAAPSGEQYFEGQLKVIRDNVKELNRQRNLLKLAKDGAGGSYRSTIDALWKSIDVTPAGIRTGGWLESVLAKYPQDVPRIAAAVNDDSRQRAEQKALFYEAEQARIELLLSQFDLQLSLARVPHGRSSDLLSLGDEKLVKSTMLGEIDRVGAAWASRSKELQSLAAAATAQLQRLTADPPAAPSSVASLAASMDPRNLVVVPPDSGLTTAPAPREALERAVVNAWLTVQQREQSELATALPLLDSARQHVAVSAAPDWNSLPHYTVALATFHAPVLENLHYYGALDSGVSASTVAGLLGGLTQEFEAEDDANGPGRLPNIFNAQAQRGAVLDGLTKATLDVAPDELAYGLLALERCSADPAPVLTATAAETAAAPATGFRIATNPPPAPEAPAIAVATPYLSEQEQLALRAGLVGQLDIMLRSPDDSGLAAFDMAYLKFMRWYAALGLPAQLPAAPAATSDKLSTQSYGFKTASHDP